MSLKAGGADSQLDLEARLLKAQLRAHVLDSAREPVQLGRFEIIRRLGRGGGGMVYEAFDAAVGGHVALKQLHGFDPRGAARLKREFRALSGVAHPNLVALHELFEARGQLFFTMELVTGVPFSTYCRPWNGARSALDEVCLRGALAQLVGGVSAIHAVNRLHCDLKSSNVLVEPSGRVVILDYGLAREVATGATVTSLRTGLGGTPAYLSPEQAAGRTATAASDWYAIGVMLFEALTGRLPFAGSPAEVLQAKQAGAAPTPRSLFRELPADLDALCTKLLERDPQARADERDLRVFGPLSTSEPSSVRPPRVSYGRAQEAQSDPFFGRTSQLHALHAAFARSQAGHPTLVLVHGPSGIGKTALLQRFAQELDRSVESYLLEGRCYEHEHVPYKAFDALVDGLSLQLARLDDDALTGVLPRHVDALLQVFPALTRVAGMASARETKRLEQEPRDVRNRAFGALRELLQRLRDRQPLVMIVDDVQWGDVDSVQLLHHVLSAPDAPALLWVGACRRDEMDSSEFLQKLVRRDAVQLLAFDVELLALDGLDDAPARALADDFLQRAGCVDERLTQRIIREAQGQPLFIAELARVAISAGDPSQSAVSLEAALCSRIVELPTPARALLDVLAVAARPLSERVLLAAAGLPGDARSAVTVLCVARLARRRSSPAGDTLEIYHDRVRQAALRELDDAALQALHGQIAGALQRQGAHEPEQLVEHLAHAGDHERAGRVAVTAAAEAVQKLAFNRAVELFRQALKWLPSGDAQRASLHEQYAYALACAGRGAQAAHAYLEAAAATPAMALRLERLAAQQYLRSGRVTEGTRLARKLLRAVDLRYPESAAEALAAYGWTRGRLRLQSLTQVTLAPEAERAALTERLETLEALFREFSVLDVLRGGALQTRYLIDARRCGDRRRTLLGMVWESHHQAVLGGQAGMRRLQPMMADIARLATEQGDAYAMASLRMAEAGFLIFACGRFRDALTSTREADALFRNECQGASWELGWVAFLRSVALEFSGDLRDMLSEAQARTRECAERDDLFQRGLLLHSLPFAKLMQDDPSGCEAALRLSAPSLETGFTTFHYLAAIRSSDAAAYVGDFQRAQQHMQDIWPAYLVSGLTRAPLTRSSALYHRSRNAIGAYLQSRDASLLREAERLTQIAARHGAGFGGFPHLLEASLALVQGQRDLAMTKLACAVQAFSICQSERGIWYAQYRMAQLRRDRAGLAQAEQALKQEGVVDPARWVACWSPAPEWVTA